jgi:cytochrome c-type biogenesis protein CcmE
MQTKKKGVILTGIVAILAMGGVTAAFVTSASPYVTVAQALHTDGDRLHLAGVIEPGTLHDDRIHNRLTFTLIDKKGDRIPVLHTGEPVANLADVKQVVAIGHVVNGVFLSQKMDVKCPTKYEAAPSLSGA